jgi:hypothetical protein
MKGFRGRRPVVVLALTSLALGGISSRAAEPRKGWELGEVRDVPVVETRSMRAAGTGDRPGVKIEQVAVIRPNVRPGDRAAAETQYAVTAPGGTMQVRETRIVQFNGTTLTTRDKVVTRQSGRVRSESSLAVPVDAAEGIYTVTVILAPVATTRSASPEEKAETIFIVKGAGSAPAPAPPPAGQPTGASPGGSPAGDPLQISLWADKDKYRIGEKVSFFFETNRDAYITLVNKGTSGKITVLFPNAYAPGFLVKGKTRYRIPAPGDPYDMQMSGPPGQEMVVATATSAPMGLVSGSTTVPDAAILTRDINVHAANSPFGERAQKELVLEVIE